MCLGALRGEHSLKVARRARAGQTFPHLSVPFHLLGTVVVPNLTTCQKTVVTNILRRIISNAGMKAYEKQAPRHTVRVVRANPHTVRSVFQGKTMRQSRLECKPQCHCSTFQEGAPEHRTVQHIDGHVALLPLHLGVGGHSNLRPNDPVPVPGSATREKVVAGITEFAKHLSAQLPPLDTLLPPSLFPESGTLLRQLQKLSAFLSKYQYIRIVDKGAGELWGFCSAWVRDKVTEFMITEKFPDTQWSQEQWDTNVATTIQEMQLQRNQQGKLCVMHVLAKAKSLRTGKWVFRGISASPARILPCQQLRLAAQAFTCMLRLLHSEIGHNFQCGDIRQASGWFHFVARKGARSLCELDCKKQFDNIHPKMSSSPSLKQQTGCTKNESGRRHTCNGQSTVTHPNWTEQDKRPAHAFGTSPTTY